MKNSIPGVTDLLVGQEYRPWHYSSLCYLNLRKRMSKNREQFSPQLPSLRHMIEHSIHSPPTFFFFVCFHFTWFSLLCFYPTPLYSDSYPLCHFLFFFHYYNAAYGGGGEYHQHSQQSLDRLCGFLPTACFLNVFNFWGKHIMYTANFKVILKQILLLIFKYLWLLCPWTLI